MTWLLRLLGRSPRPQWSDLQRKLAMIAIDDATDEKGYWRRRHARGEA